LKRACSRDVLETYADVSDLIVEFGFRPGARVNAGMAEVVAWDNG
jgi:hypothetical protein